MYQFDAGKFATDLFNTRPEGLRRLAQRVCVRHQSIYDVERKRNQPSVPLFLALCRELNLSPTDYIEGEGNKLQPGSYALDIDRLSAALEVQPIPQHLSYHGDTPTSYLTAWRLRTGYHAHAPYMHTLMALCTWLQMPPSAFLVATK